MAVPVAVAVSESKVTSSGGGGGGGKDDGDEEIQEDGHDKQDDSDELDLPSAAFTALFKHADSIDAMLMLVGTAGAVVGGSTLPVFSVLFGDLVQSLGEGKANINTIVISFAVLAAIALVSSYLEVALFRLASQRMAGRVQRAYLKALLDQDPGYFDTSDKLSGKLLSSISNDAAEYKDSVSEKASNVVHHTSTLLVGMGIGFWYNWVLSLVLLACIPLLAAAGAVMSNSLENASKANAEAFGNAGAIVTETVGAARIVYSLGIEDKFVKQFGDTLKTTIAMGRRAAAGFGFGQGVIDFVFFGIYALALWYGAKQITDGDATGGDVMTTLFAVVIGGFGIGNTAPGFAAFAKGRAALARINAVLERQPAIADPADGGKEPSNATGTLVMTDVAFAYPSRPGVPILQGLNLSVASGESVALVGKSGSGKSTVIQLVERFYDPLGGKITFDGHELKSLKLAWLRSHLGLVSQEPTLFATSIRENILYGRPGATQADIEAACLMAHVTEFVSTLPDKFETQAGERGVQLSGGQKQRIAIARAVLRNPTLLLLDEATSALDTESERLVQDALDKLMERRSSIAIAHRLSTIQNSDKIVVMQKGRKVEEGTHEQLRNTKDGVYSMLLRQQQGRGSTDDLTKVESQASFDDEEDGEDGGKVVSKSPTKVMSKTLSKSSSNKDGEEEKKEGEEESEEEKAVNVGFADLWPYQKPEAGWIVVGIIGSMLAGVVLPLFAVAFAGFFDVFFMPEGRARDNKVMEYSLMMLGLGIASFVGKFFAGLGLGIAGNRLALRLREALFGAYMNQEIGFYDEARNTSGAIVSRVEKDTMNIRGALGDRFGVALRCVVCVAAGYTIGFFRDWKLTLVITAIFPLIVGSAAIDAMFRMGFDAGQGKKEIDPATQLAADAVANVRVVQAYDMSMPIIDAFTARRGGTSKEEVRLAHVVGMAFGFSQGIIYAQYSLCFWYGNELVKKGEMKFNEVFEVFFAILCVGFGLAEAGTMAPAVAEAPAAIKRVFAVLHRQPAIADPADGGKEPSNATGTLVMTDVAFAYPSRPGVPILQGLNLSVASGESVALVGKSGSGKSTVIQLVERFYDPLGGKITFDGHELKSLKLAWLRSHLGLVSQEPTLFATSIRENILYGRPGATQADIEAACLMAHVTEFVSTLPDKFETQAGERGVQLSGGQKQRIAIARAVLRNPTLLLLDEATSALDTESERLVQDALDKLMERRSSIAIAHRLSTIQNSDKIVVMQKGRKVEEGTHSALLSMNGIYTKMHTLNTGGAL